MLHNNLCFTSRISTALSLKYGSSILLNVSWYLSNVELIILIKLTFSSLICCFTSLIISGSLTIWICASKISPLSLPNFCSVKVFKWLSCPIVWLIPDSNLALAVALSIMFLLFSISIVGWTKQIALA